MNDTVLKLPVKKLTEQEVSALLAKAIAASKALDSAKAAHTAAAASHKAAWTAHREACKALELGQ
jgi:hypothetical protein